MKSGADNPNNSFVALEKALKTERPVKNGPFFSKIPECITISTLRSSLQA